MIVSCENCEKRYKIDETKLKEGKTLFKCEACGSIIEVIKPKPEPQEPSPAMDFREPFAPDKPAEKEEATPPSPKQKKQKPKKTKKKKKKTPKRTGMSIRLRLLFGFLGFVLIVGGVITFLYQKYVPPLVEKELHNHTFSISKAFSAAVSDPLLLNNYLQVNKAAEVIAGLPSVSYASVINNNGTIVAGIFGDTSRLNEAYQERIKKERFPKELSRLNTIPQGRKDSSKRILVGGQNIYDVGVAIPGSFGEAHVGVYTADAEKIVSQGLPRLLIVLTGLGLICALCFFFVVSTIVSKPIKHLSDAAHRISLGEIDHPITSKGGGEVAELAASLERMRFSIKSAVDRLRRR